MRHHPELKVSQIGKLIGTTKNTITAIGERTHWNSPNIRPRDPVLLGLCGQADLNLAVDKARKAAEKAGITLPQREDPEAAPQPGSDPAPTVFTRAPGSGA